MASIVHSEHHQGPHHHTHVPNRAGPPIPRILSNVPQSLSSSIPVAFDLILEMISYSATVNSADELYIQEDGLDLWLTTLAYSREGSAKLLTLCPLLAPIVKRDFDHVKVSPVPRPL